MDDETTGRPPDDSSAPSPGDGETRPSTAVTAVATAVIA